jgi:hypothetical protein
MAMMQMWDRRKGLNHEFINRQVKEQFRIGGCEVLCHKYLGVYDQANSESTGSSLSGLLGIEDVVLMENRDRKYDPNVYELRGSYNVQDYEFSMSQFSLFLESDVLYLEFPVYDVVDKLGRNLMAGDVLEFPHLRDIFALNDLPASNKFYVVQSVNRAAGGWAQNWREYIIRVKCTPMTASQEYSDILNGPALDPDGDPGNVTVGDLITDGAAWNTITNQLEILAEQNFLYRHFETRHFYVVANDELGNQNPWLYAGDGVPPNGAVLSGSGTIFPTSPDDGEWFLNTGQFPYTLYQFKADIDRTGPIAKKYGGTWTRMECDFRTRWQACNDILMSFISNTNITTLEDGTTMPEKQYLHGAIKPRADF